MRMGIEAWDRVGLLRDITTALAGEGVNIASVVTEEHDGGTVSTHLTLHVTGMEQLSRLFTQVEGVRGVINVMRVTTGRSPAPAKAGGARKRVD